MTYSISKAWLQPDTCRAGCWSSAFGIYSNSRRTDQCVLILINNLSPGQSSSVLILVQSCSPRWTGYFLADSFHIRSLRDSHDLEQCASNKTWAVRGSRDSRPWPVWPALLFVLLQKRNPNCYLVAPSSVLTQPAVSRKKRNSAIYEV